MTRTFTGSPPDPGLLDRLLAQALRAPTAGNSQGCDLLVLDDRRTIDRYWEASTDPAWRARSSRFAGLARAPVAVLAFGDRSAYVRRYREDDKAGRAEGSVDWVVPFWLVDAGFAVMSLLLGAADAGLGAAFLGNFRNEDRVKTAFGVPGHIGWLGTVLLGEGSPDDPRSASLDRPGRPIAARVHRGGW
jgi:nitroreductase